MLKVIQMVQSQNVLLDVPSKEKKNIVTLGESSILILQMSEILQQWQWKSNCSEINYSWHLEKQGSDKINDFWAAR